MEMDFNLSPDTQAILLLCGSLGRADRSLLPLTPGQYAVFMSAVVGLGKRPADLLGESGPDEDLIREACEVPNANGRVKPADGEQILALLRRGVTLSTAIDKWSAYGVRVVSKADEAYPKRLREHLAGKAPALVYFAGNPALFAGGGMAFVGARDINAEATEAIRTVVRGCVDLGMPVVSGGARGADQVAMQEAFSLGGKVIGAMPCELLKACLEPSNRDALAAGNILLFSTFDPELRPFSYGQVAMDRNKYIYGMADACFVAQSGIGSKSGTWAGAAEELKRENRNPVFVYLGTPPSDGCLDLQKKGAMAWDPKKTVAENLDGADKAGMASPRPTDQFFDFSATAAASASDDVTPKTSEQKPDSSADVAPPASKTPYDLFLDELKFLLSAPRKEADVKKRLGSKLDLVSQQVKHWLERAETDGVVVKKEYPTGKKTCVMLELVGGKLA